MQPQKSFANISDCKDIIQCAFSLNEFEIEVYKSTAAHGPIRADDLADRMGRDRSTVYRALQRLLTCGMVFRETRSLDKGGYFHVYTGIGRTELRTKLERCVEDWTQRMREALDRFDEHM
jgi:predicted transcriptional regulator